MDTFERTSKRKELDILMRIARELANLHADQTQLIGRIDLLISKIDERCGVNPAPVKDILGEEKKNELQ